MGPASQTPGYSPGWQAPIAQLELGPWAGIRNWGWVVADVASFPEGLTSFGLATNLLDISPVPHPAGKPRLVHRLPATVAVGPSHQPSGSSLQLAGPDSLIGAGPCAEGKEEVGR